MFDVLNRGSQFLIVWFINPIQIFIYNTIFWRLSLWLSISCDPENTFQSILIDSFIWAKVRIFYFNFTFNFTFVINKYYEICSIKNVDMIKVCFCLFIHKSNGHINAAFVLDMSQHLFFSCRLFYLSVFPTLEELKELLNIKWILILDIPFIKL